jgi:uncharacterized damage-inducible protein DinB
MARHRASENPKENPWLTQVLDTWRVNDSVTQALLRAIPERGLLAVPLASRGRNVGEMLRHLQRVRAAWLGFNRHPGAKALEMFRRHRKGTSPRKADLLRAFRISGRAVERYLHARLTSGRRVQFFGGKALRWLAYMIAHESHHRGQILLALKQNGMRMPDPVAINEVWMRWYRAKTRG